jgi:two-component system chemotaxis response regulator CheY
MPKTILLVDDSRPIRQQVGTVLRATGYQTVEAENGADALITLSSRPKFALIISDVNMPHMNGIDMLKAIRQRNLAPGVPILMLTTEGLHALVEDARVAGATGWMRKPFKPDNLIAAVNKLVGGP